MIVKHFRELRVYQDAFKTAMEIYTLSKSWPRDERFSLTDQIRRSSRAVCENIAEAWRKRRYEAHFISKMMDNPEKWCSINHEVAEEQETYGS